MDVRARAPPGAQYFEATVVRRCSPYIAHLLLYLDHGLIRAYTGAVREQSWRDATFSAKLVMFVRLKLNRGRDEGANARWRASRDMSATPQTVRARAALLASSTVEVSLIHLYIEVSHDIVRTWVTAPVSWRVSPWCKYGSWWAMRGGYLRTTVASKSCEPF